MTLDGWPGSADPSGRWRLAPGPGMGFDRAGPRSRDGRERQPDGRSARRPLAPGGAGRLRPLRQDGDRGGSGHPGRLCRGGEAQPCLWRAARQIPEQAWKPDKAMDAEVARRPCVPRGWPKGTPASPGGSRSPGRTCAVTSGLDGAGPSTRTSCASWTEARPTSPQLLRVAQGLAGIDAEPKRRAHGHRFRRELIAVPVGSCPTPALVVRVAPEHPRGSSSMPERPSSPPARHGSPPSPQHRVSAPLAVMANQDPMVITQTLPGPGYPRAGGPDVRSPTCRSAVVCDGALMTNYPRLDHGRACYGGTRTSDDGLESILGTSEAVNAGWSAQPGTLCLTTPALLPPD